MLFKCSILVSAYKISLFLIFFFFAESKNGNQSGINHHTTATIAKELLDVSSSPTVKNSPVKANKTPTEKVTPVVEVSPTTKVESNNNNIGETKTISSGGIRAVDQLRYLADLLKFEVKPISFLF